MKHIIIQINFFLSISLFLTLFSLILIPVTHAEEKTISSKIIIDGTVNEHITYQQLNDGTLEVSTNSQKGYYIINGNQIKRVEGIVKNDLKITPGNTSITAGI